MAPSSFSSLVFYISPLCGNIKSKWYSPARFQRTMQISSMFHNINIETLMVSSLSKDKSLSSQQNISYMGNSFQSLLRYPLLFISSFRLLRLCYIFKPSYICLYNSRFPEFILAFLALIFYKATYIVELEDLPSARIENSGLAGFLDTISTKIYSFLGLKFLSVSDSVRLILNKDYNVRFSNILVLPPLLSDDYLSLVVNRNTPFSCDTIKILYAGGYGPEKGVDQLVQSYLESRETIKSELHLFGPISKSLMSLAASYNDIIVHGVVSRDELLNNLLNVDVLVNPHRVDTSAAMFFPFKVIEMSAAGCLFFTSRMRFVEKLDLHTESIFDSYSDLTNKLKESRRIWAHHSALMTEASLQVRLKYSIGCQSKNINCFLNP